MLTFIYVKAVAGYLATLKAAKVGAGFVMLAKSLLPEFPSELLLADGGQDYGGG